MSSVNVEIQTIEGGRLEWVAVAHFAGTAHLEKACRWGDRLLHGFSLEKSMKPNLRIVSPRTGKVLGAWQEEGWEEEGNDDD